MVKADGSVPRPLHVAWQSPPSNYFNMLPKPSLLGLPTYSTSSTFMFPAASTFRWLAAPTIPSLKTELANEGQGFLQHHNADTSLKATHVGEALHRLFYGLEAPSISSLKTVQTHEVQGFLQHHNADTSLKEEHVGGSLRNANPLQKKLLIFDRTDNKTRLFYGPVLPLVRSPTVSATKVAQSYGGNGEGQVSTGGQKNLANYSLLEEIVKDHTVIEESENHEDTEEINALLYSDDESDDDDDSDEVTSTDRSPLATNMTYVIQEEFQYMKEEVASSDWPNKRLKLIDGDYHRSSPPVHKSNLARPNETCDCVSDAESKNSSGWAYSVDKPKVENSVVCDIKLKKDKIRESLRIIENLIPGAKGKEPLLVIDGTIEYLKLLMSESSALGDKCH
ncbi:hypothetical protein Fmac_005112 [Flemingia macrophylla]|uniref:Uncharacterized protein n=1 Tax=Flemingia macrophylla TaxID=520843 RepID=A0ABD1N6T6_9FABA